MQRNGASWLVVGLAIAASACGGGQEDAAQTGMSMGTAQYTVVLKSSWTRANHPFEYPEAGALTGPHFSGLIGAAHNAGYAIFAEGSLPTPGLERLSEEGRHSPLDEEIRAAVTAGDALSVVESGPLRDFGDSLVATFEVHESHPMVSLVAMIAPSPDWFTGVANVNLVENGAWVPSRTLELHAWDSGGDDGVTYKAPDRNADPKKPTSMAMTRHFVANGRMVPVGTVTFTRQ